MPTLTNIPNKFQALIESHDAKYYLEQERIAKSIVLSEEGLRDKLLPSLLEAAHAHAEQRVQSIIRRVGSQAPEAIVEALCDPHYRKQRNFGPTREAIQHKVELAVARQEPITLLALMFTRKNVCALKRNGMDTATVDMAEIISLVHLNSFAELIARFHPYGAKYYILSEGTRFARTFELSDKSVDLYQSRLDGWVQRLGLKHLEVIDYEQFLSKRLGPKEWEKRVAGYEEALIRYRTLMEPIFDPDDLSTTFAKAIERDPVLDARNPRNNFIPLWDSIKHSLPYPEIAEGAKTRGVEYVELYRELFRNLEHVRYDAELENLRGTVLRKSWDAAIEHNARVMGDVIAGIDVAALVSPAAFRTTINPKPESPNLGIYSVRETTSRVQPWHGTAYVRADGENRLLPTVLSKLEIESRGGIPVCVGSRQKYPFFYADPDAIAIVQSDTPSFNMSTR